MRRYGLAGLAWSGRGQSAGFASPVANAAGNNLPGITGRLDRPFGPGPGPNATGGQLGGIGDGQMGSDPRAAMRAPWPKSSLTDAGTLAEGQVSQPAAKFSDGNPPIPYGGSGSFQGRGLASQTGIYGEVSDPGPHPSWWRGGIQGFNDKLTVKDRHGYFDTGNQKTGVDGFGPAGSPNAYNNPRDEPPRPDFRLINRTVSFQIGSDATRNQDDLTRGYTWLGEQGSGWGVVYGGVPGLYQPYGTRGGVPFPIVSPAELGQPGDGPRLVWSGPPHGLHSQTPWKGGAQLLRRYGSIPQTRPVRQDRPSNSPQAGQSYSQTVRMQGASPVRPANVSQSSWRGAPGAFFGTSQSRGWAGQHKVSGSGQNWISSKKGPL